MAASVWMYWAMLSRSRAREVSRPSALTMPEVTVDWNPNGLPTASTRSPTISWPESPRRATGNPRGPRNDSTAMSWRGSRPTSCASKSRPSSRVTVMLSESGDHVVVGQHVVARTAVAHDDARTGAARLPELRLRPWGATEAAHAARRHRGVDLDHYRHHRGRYLPERVLNRLQQGEPGNLARPPWCLAEATRAVDRRRGTPRSKARSNRSRCRIRRRRPPARRSPAGAPRLRRWTRGARASRRSVIQGYGAPPRWVSLPVVIP